MPGAAIKGHSLRKATCAGLILLRGLFFDLLEDCSGQENPINRGEICPAGAAKKGDPITAPKPIANSEVGSFGLGKLGFALVAETIAQNKKDD
jgi:hypothetical protein